MRTAVIIVIGTIVILVLAVAVFIAATWAPERSVAELAGRWAPPRHLNKSDRVALLIEGDDGTRLTKVEIAAALRHPEAAAGEPDLRRS